ncbi:MAG: hypothetical protein H0X37_22430 [Herpetosiphonaceae bacterium]|nr:hypothetical protein [Herpetosiphonaceae bacterium]
MATRGENAATPIVKGGWLYTDGDSVQLDTPAWVAWLQEHTTFYLEAEQGTFTARKEMRWDGQFWYAYRRHQGKLHKAYLGKAEDLTKERLLSVASKLTDKAGA